MEVFEQDVVASAVAQAIKLGVLSFDAIKQIAVSRIERRPPQLDLERYPHLPKASVAVTRAADYAALTAGEGGMSDPRDAQMPRQPTPKYCCRIISRSSSCRRCLPNTRSRPGSAPKQGIDHPRYLLRLVELELIERQRKMVERRVRAAKFPATKSLDSFDFKALPSLNKVLVNELARGEFIIRRENIIALGPSGTGKTHLAIGIGMAACQRGMSVGFVTAAGLVNALTEARDEKRLLRLQSGLAKLQLLIIDELGYVPLSQTGAELSVRGDLAALRARLDTGNVQSAIRRLDQQSSVQSASPVPCSIA